MTVFITCCLVRWHTRTVVSRQTVHESLIVVEAQAVRTQRVELGCRETISQNSVNYLTKISHMSNDRLHTRHGLICLECTWLGDGAGVDLTVISPSHSNGAAAFLLGDVGGQDAVAEHGVVQVQVAFLLFLHEHADRCGSESSVKRTGSRPEGRSVWRTLTLASAFVLRQDVAAAADARVRAGSVLAGAVGLAEAPVCGAFIHVWKADKHTLPSVSDLIRSPAQWLKSSPMSGEKKKIFSRSVSNAVAGVSSSCNKCTFKD